MAHPTCPRLSKLAAERRAHSSRRGCDAKAEPISRWKARNSLRWRNPSSTASAGLDVIGMTNMPEAKLAREAELPYAAVAMVTDFDCWHEEHDAVTVTDVLKVLHNNADKAKQTVAHLAAALAQTPRTPSPIDTCLDYALITAPGAARSRRWQPSSTQCAGACCADELGSQISER